MFGIDIGLFLIAAGISSAVLVFLINPAAIISSEMQAEEEIEHWDC